jgi:fatty-acyl-CoA synthase
MRESVEASRRAMADRHPNWPLTTLDRYFDRAARDFSERPLVLTDDVTLTYRNVEELSLRLAVTLKNAGIGPGDKVGILIPNIPFAVPLLFAIWRQGAVTVPINTLYRADELTYVLRHSECKCLITVPSFNGQDFIALLDEIMPNWREKDFKGFPDLRSVIVHNGNDLGTLGDEAGEVSDDPAESHSEPDGPAVIMYTSGTTGAPKGVVQTHDNLLRAAYGGAFHKAFEPGRRAIFSLPLYHVFGLVVGVLSSIVVGGAIIPLPKFDPKAMLTAIGRHRATYLMAVPTMSIALLEEAERSSYDLSSLNTVHNASALTPTWVWQALRDRFGVTEIFTSYGQTETTATIVCTAPGDSLDTVSTCVGRAVVGGVAGIPEAGGLVAEFKMIDPETGADLPPGIPGEICTRGPMNSLGYYKNEEETAKLFLPGGWLRTGDLGVIREDGYFQLTGRAKELYKSGGENVSPKEVEEMLVQHPGISQVFVVGVPDDRWGEVGCAWIVRSGEGSALTADEVIAFAKQNIARFKVPKQIFFIDADDLPKTGTGKVQKNKLKDAALRNMRTSAEV